MRVTHRLLAFAAVLAVAFGGAAAVGATVGPADEPSSPADAGGGGHDGRKPHAGAATAAAKAPGGLAVSQDGLTLETERTRFAAGEPARFAFRIVDARGEALRDAFELEAEREMHLIVVRADATAYRHLHPRRDDQGNWQTRLTLPEAGVYRAYADFKVGERQRTLATTLTAPGDFRPRALPSPTPTVAGGPFEVGLRAPGLRAGREAGLTFAVSREGRPAEGLERHLGARGHLVALREGDLAYLHVHPTAVHRRRPHEVPFTATFPSAGRYRLFLQLRADGRVRTVALTLEVPR
jgi:hypothetical protein